MVTKPDLREHLNDLKNLMNYENIHNFEDLCRKNEHRNPACKGHLSTIASRDFILLNYRNGVEVLSVVFHHAERYSTLFVHADDPLPAYFPYNDGHGGRGQMKVTAKLEIWDLRKELDSLDDIIANAAPT